MKKYIITGLLIAFSFQFSHSQEERLVRIETTMGDMVVKLYNETPLHRDNFIKLAKEGFYDGQLFHRVIRDFMIQTGDPNSIDADKGEMLGMGGPGYTIPAEIIDKYHHKKGALAAARKGDHVNPEKESSGSQFYIVQGKIYSPMELDAFVRAGRHEEFTDEQIDDYISIGGSPHLDGEYTVFGELVEGFEVLDEISKVSVDNYNRPVEDIIIKMEVIK
jgi:peptidyl-prolyl cis-trans isomerase B (cyclophilin B)